MKAGHGGSRVGMTSKDGVGATEYGEGVESGDTISGVELLSPFGIEVKEEETGVGRLLWGIHDFLRYILKV